MTTSEHRSCRLIQMSFSPCIRKVGPRVPSPPSRGAVLSLTNVPRFLVRTVSMVCVCVHHPTQVTCSKQIRRNLSQRSFAYPLRFSGFSLRSFPMLHIYLLHCDTKRVIVHYEAPSRLRGSLGISKGSD